VDVHIELLRVREDGLEQGAGHLDATAGLELIALVRLEVGLQVDRDIPGGQDVDVRLPHPRPGLDRLGNAFDLELVADRALLGVEGELGLAPAVRIARDSPSERIQASEGRGEFDLGIGPGAADEDDREQADKGKGNKDSSLHDAPPWVGTGQEDQSLDESVVLRKLDDTVSSSPVRCDMQHGWRVRPGMTRSGREEFSRSR
jgi:hypothetical protein